MSNTYKTVQAIAEQTLEARLNPELQQPFGGVQAGTPVVKQEEVDRNTKLCCMAEFASASHADGWVGVGVGISEGVHIDAFFSKMADERKLLVIRGQQQLSLLAEVEYYQQRLQIAGAALAVAQQHAPCPLYSSTIKAIETPFGQAPTYTVEVYNKESFRFRIVCSDGRCSGWASYTQVAYLDGVAAITGYYSGNPDTELKALPASRILAEFGVGEVGK